MIKIVILVFLLVCIFYVLKIRSKSKKVFYSRLIFSIVLIGVLFIIMTSGKLIIPQILQIAKIGLPFITKFIGL